MTIMKRFLCLVLSFLFIFCYGCSKKEENTQKGEYLVTYNLMGGTYFNNTENIEIKIKAGNTTSEIIPTKEGYTFIGWTTRLTEVLNADFDFNNPINNNTVLYAIWRRPQVTYELNGGYFGSYQSIEELIDDFLGDFSAYKGYNVAAGNFFDASYGRSIEFFKNENYGDKWNPLLVYLKDYASEPQYLEKFINSNKNYNSTTSPFVRAEIAAFLQQIEYVRRQWPYVTTVPYNNGNIQSSIWKYFKGSSINFYDSTSDYTLPTPYKDGYIFEGWYDNPEFVGDKITYIPKGYTENSTFYAKWKNEIKINYVSNLEIKYETKYDLFVDFFTEYYNFLLSNNYGDVLVENDINTLEIFLEVALDYNYGNGQMRGLANIISSSFLDIEVGGTLETQTTNKFIGYCYHNNKFLTFIEFYMEFFAWWRLDEGYTTSTNNGSDFFASSWAALVDLCKFFYYDENTSYVQTDRIYNCFKYIPEVVLNCYLTPVYKGQPLYEQNIMYYGYTFVGFYADENYTIDANEFLASTDQTEVTLYMKFEKNN